MLGSDLGNGGVRDSNNRGAPPSNGVYERHFTNVMATTPLRNLSSVHENRNATVEDEQDVVVISILLDQHVLRVKRHQLSDCRDRASRINSA